MTTRSSVAGVLLVACLGTAHTRGTVRGSITSGVWMPTLPALYITAAFHTHDPIAEIYWSIPGEDFSGDRSLGGFSILPDGQFHEYAVNLLAHPAYTGIITGLRFDPSGGGTAGDYVDIASISFRRDETSRLPRVVVRPQ